MRDCRKIAKFKFERSYGNSSSRVKFSTQREKYRELSNKFNDLKKIYPSIDVLSIGMSNDYEAAIAEGSTMVRLGTALFGARL